MEIETVQEIESAVDVGDEEFEACMAEAWDDIRGGFIDAKLVKEARKEAIEIMKRKGDPRARENACMF